MNKWIIHIIIVLSLLSCEEKIDWKTIPEQSDEIIVDCILTNEYKRQEVKLSHLTANINEKALPVTGAYVSISTSDTNYVLVETPITSGIYLSDSVQAVIGRNYYLYIEHDGKTYTAQTYMLPVSHFAPLNYAFTNDSLEMYEVTSVANTIDGQEQSMWHVYIDWTNVNGYDTIPEEDKTAKLVYYSLSSVDAGQIFSPNKEKILFPPGTQITQTKYSLTPDYAEFIRTLLAETEWRGGFFDTQPANVITNISNGALGYFTASTVYSIEFIAN